MFCTLRVILYKFHHYSKILGVARCEILYFGDLIFLFFNKQHILFMVDKRLGNEVGIHIVEDFSSLSSVRLHGKEAMYWQLLERRLYNKPDVASRGFETRRFFLRTKNKSGTSSWMKFSVYNREKRIDHIAASRE